ncbi:MAG TPA: hypothetical protein VFQ42_04155 [Mycobacterium sp.]|nr:hypothetical protein [Mycobacterium sp.]
MPSMISSATEFRPLRWLVVVLLLCALAFAVGVIYGTDQVSPAPTCTVAR